MDPSAIKCLYKNSFDKAGEIPMILHTYDTTNKVNNKVTKQLSLSNGSEISNNDGKLVRNYCDKDLSNQVIVSTVVANNINLFDPFHDVSYNPFLSRDSIVLGNIDAIFNFSHHTGGYIITQDTKDFNFATLEDGPGHFTQYILYRNPNSYGYGITPIEYPFDGQIDITHFNITAGASGTGNLVKDYKSFIQFVRTVEATGLNLVVGNYIGDIFPVGYLVRLVTALGIVSIGGTFVCKVSQLDDPLMLDLLWITTQCFNKVTLFKPLSTPSYNKVYYVIAADAKVNNIEWIGYLEDSYNRAVKEGKSIERLLGKLPNPFVRWVTDYNNFILLYNKYLINETNRGVTELYDTYKCKAIWNLPQL